MQKLMLLLLVAVTAATCRSAKFSGAEGNKGQGPSAEVVPKPTDPKDPDKPSEPSNPTDPDDPNDSSNPSDPNDPGNPSDPNDPGNPSDPKDPGNPSDPKDPGNPNDPKDPTDPKDPKGPDNPGQSGPDNPGQSGPDNPGQSGPDNPGQSGPDNPGQSGGKGPKFEECKDAPHAKLVAGLYALPENTQKLPDLSKLTKKKDICIRQLDIANHDFKEGFPGVRHLFEWFALDIRWKVNIPKDGVYEFTLNSDDGAILSIDGTEVIDNDGLHPSKEITQKVKITKGQHNFRVKYFQGPRHHIALELFWKTPDGEKRTLIPEKLFSRP